jgi:hypothetical protein
MRPRTLREIKTIEQMKQMAYKIPGVEVRTDVPCRAIKPCGPEVHNLHMTECHGMLLHHEGPHSWEK